MITSVFVGKEKFKFLKSQFNPSSCVICLYRAVNVLIMLEYMSAKVNQIPIVVLSQSLGHLLRE